MGRRNSNPTPASSPWPLAVIAMKLKILIGLLSLSFLFGGCKKTDEQLLDEALSYYQSKNYNEAIRINSKVINSNKKLQEPYYNRAFCYWKLNKLDSALTDFQKVLDLHMIGNFQFELNKNSPFASDEAKFQVSYNDALYQKAQLEYELNNLKGSFEDFKRLVNEDYEKSNCFLWLGTIMLRQGKQTKALNYFNLSKKAATNKEDIDEANRLLRQFDSTQATNR